MKLGPRRLELREDGVQHVTPIVANGVCAFCREVIPERAAGRPRKFCDSTCRAAAHRGSKSRRRPKQRG